MGVRRGRGLVSVAILAKVGAMAAKVFGSDAVQILADIVALIPALAAS